MKYQVWVAATIDRMERECPGMAGREEPLHKAEWVWPLLGDREVGWDAEGGLDAQPGTTQLPVRLTGKLPTEDPPTVLPWNQGNQSLRPKRNTFWQRPWQALYCDMGKGPRCTLKDRQSRAKKGGCREAIQWQMAHCGHRGKTSKTPFTALQSLSSGLELLFPKPIIFCFPHLSSHFGVRELLLDKSI